jgi:predicted outer membrane protein
MKIMKMSYIADKQSITSLCLFVFAATVSLAVFGQSSVQLNPETTFGALDRDATFVREAARFNLEQIRLSKLARQNGSTPEVKALAEQMQQSHEASIQSLTTLGNRAGIDTPTTYTPEGNSAYNKLKALKGKDFDKAYTDLIIKDHQTAIPIYEEASEKCVDPEIKLWASAELSQLHKHVHHAKTGFMVKGKSAE